MCQYYLIPDDLAYIWTSGRLCNFKGCDRDDLQPVQVNGWFWSGSGVKMAPTNSTPPGWSYQPWSGKEKSIKKGKLFFREINILYTSRTKPILKGICFVTWKKFSFYARLT